VGLALHLQNGALFGAAYAAVAPLVPIPGPVRGLLASMIENFGLWPMGRLTDRYHPARADLVALTGNRRAMWQATWRHALFGVLVGELERRLNGPRDELPPDLEAVVSSNGHGRLEDAVPATTG
jgi:hypothetical protein